MTEDQFSALVTRLEASAQRNPAGYRRRVVWLALLGYAYLGVVLVILTLLFVASVASLLMLKGLALKLIIPMGAFIVLVLRALWVRLEPPAGREVQPAEAPELFAAIEDLRRKLRAPRFHRVLITDDFNAAVVQVPRLGMLGWHRNYLLVGLPLLKSLTIEQLRAVLAHEFGHLSAGHGRIGNWIYRLRMSWARLMAVLEHQRSWGTFMFRRFFNWYVPYFAAYSFPLARANEYQADAVAAAVASPRAAAEALTAVSVVGSYLAERYWPDVHKRADDTPQPAFAPYSAMGEHFRSGLGDDAVRGWLQQALDSKTGVSNTHPSLGDRLAAIGQAPRLALPAPGAAADALLGASLPQIAGDFDRRWREGILAAWEQRHREVREGRARLAALEQQLAAGGALEPAAAFERARLTEAVGAGEAVALEQFRALHAREPGNPVYAFALGQRLLARDDEAGFKLIEQAIAEDEDAILPGCELLRNHCARQGRDAEARTWYARAVERAQELQDAQTERATVYLSDTFDPHGLPDNAVEALRRRLRGIPGLRKVYLVRKRVQHLAHHPHFIAGFAITPWWRLHNKRRAAEVQQAVLDIVRTAGDVTVISVEGDNYRFGRKLAWRRGSRIL